MAELKTKKKSASVPKFLARIADKEQREDSQKLLKVFSQATTEKGAMWGASIVGFGSYHYKSERSSQEGDWFLTGFSPRKNYTAVYIIAGTSHYKKQLKKLGKHKISSGSCIYIKKLSDINTTILKSIIKDSVKVVKKMYGVK